MQWNELPEEVQIKILLCIEDFTAWCSARFVCAKWQKITQKYSFKLFQFTRARRGDRTQIPTLPNGVYHGYQLVKYYNDTPYYEKFFMYGKLRYECKYTFIGRKWMEKIYGDYILYKQLSLHDSCTVIGATYPRDLIHVCDQHESAGQHYVSIAIINRAMFRVQFQIIILYSGTIIYTMYYITFEKSYKTIGLIPFNFHNPLYHDFTN